MKLSQPTPQRDEAHDKIVDLGPVAQRRLRAWSERPRRLYGTVPRSRIAQVGASIHSALSTALENR